MIYSSVVNLVDDIVLLNAMELKAVFFSIQGLQSGRRYLRASSVRAVLTHPLHLTPGFIQVKIKSCMDSTEILFYFSLFIFKMEFQRC